MEDTPTTTSAMLGGISALLGELDSRAVVCHERGSVRNRGWAVRVPECAPPSLTAAVLGGLTDVLGVCSRA